MTVLKAELKSINSVLRFLSHHQGQQLSLDSPHWAHGSHQGEAVFCLRCFRLKVSKETMKFLCQRGVTNSCYLFSCFLIWMWLWCHAYQHAAVAGAAHRVETEDFGESSERLWLNYRSEQVRWPPVAPLRCHSQVEGAHICIWQTHTHH